MYLTAPCTLTILHSAFRTLQLYILHLNSACELAHALTANEVVECLE